jgi:hypothetical protein
VVRLTISACPLVSLPIKEKTCFPFTQYFSQRKAEIGETEFRRIIVRHQAEEVL